ncbi:TetR/AcrR family transcriptional regulator [Alterisphingorhabdus coralli]|uniref:TetR/AcrR family transcriptional regulator n=1 Tax=Alterisphingorhabdus coralli TaxID=3071408 RepID=A0AA97F853_9SPHN|nr:TetR/AcrR family transcriptional regulator [Parasphingorhabdus sp. SCSIO 66989]WOE76104.1 TetR/AcrR family transcriptional regulator [Parasphingorhabdus sp. SCSIO 66989]
MSERKTQIIHAATSLFLAEGVGVSTASIAKAAGVSNGTLFNAFATKQALIDAIYLAAKSAMFAAVPHSGSDSFTRAHLLENWRGYLAWARANPEERAIMHLLLEAGLTSAETQAQVDQLAKPSADWIQTALDTGVIRGPNAGFVGKLIFFQLDLVITENLHSEEADLAFDMLCTSIGLKS